MRLKIVINFFSILLLVFLSVCVVALESQDMHRSYCISTGILNFDIQLYPEVGGVYTSFLNKHNKSITDLYYEIIILNGSSHAIYRKNVSVPLLKQYDIFCRYYDEVEYIYNTDLKLMFFNPKYIFGDEQMIHYSLPFNDTFRIDKCITINKWNREEIIKYNGNKEVKDKIVFKKVCNKTFNINIEYPDIKSPFIAPHYSTLFYDNQQSELEVKPNRESKTIEIEINKGVPSDEILILVLEYDLQYNLGKKENLFWYPFYTTFNTFTTRNIIPKKAYITLEDGTIFEEVTDIGLYRTEISIPDGFTHKDTPNELEYDKVFERWVIKNKDNSSDSIGAIYPSCSCHNISSFPSDCIQFNFNPAPHQESLSNKIIWQSIIVNGEPKQLSFDIIEFPAYKYLWVFLFMMSIILICFIAYNKKGYMELILSYFAILFAIKTLTSLPPHFNLFDLLISVTVIIVISLAIIDRMKKSKVDYICKFCSDRNKRLSKHRYNSKIGKDHIKFNIT